MAYRRPGTDRVLPIAELQDPELTLEVARRVLLEKNLEAEGLSVCDSDLGMLAKQEVGRLESALGLLIPELRPAHAVAGSPYRM